MPLRLAGSHLLDGNGVEVASLVAACGAGARREVICRFALFVVRVNAQGFCLHTGEVAATLCADAGFRTHSGWFSSVNKMDTVGGVCEGMVPACCCQVLADPA